MQLEGREAKPKAMPWVKGQGKTVHLTTGLQKPQDMHIACANEALLAELHLENG